MHIVWFRK